MRFAVVVGNPPFGNIHLKIIDCVIPKMKKDGMGCFIHPARWFEDPLAEYKRDSDKAKFKGIVDRLDYVKILDTITVEKTFGITRNGDLMITSLKAMPTGKRIEIYEELAQESIAAILSFSKESISRRTR